MFKDSDFAKICYFFPKLTEAEQEEILKLMTEEQKKAFLTAVGCIRIMSDKKYHDKIMNLALIEYLERMV